MKHRAHFETDTTFMHKAGVSARRHWQTAVVSIALSTLTGTIVPMLQNWHDEEKADAALEAVRSDLQHDIDILQQQVYFLQKQNHETHPINRRP